MFNVLVQLLQTSFAFSVICSLMPGGGEAVLEEIRDAKKKKKSTQDFILSQKPGSSEEKEGQVILTEWRT